MENDYVIKRPVMGPLAKIWRITFLTLLVVCTAVLGYLAWRFTEQRIPLLIALAAVAVVNLLLAYFVPRVGYYGHYSYVLSEEAVTLYQKDEPVMRMPWAETEVSLGSYIKKGSVDNPAACAKAICFARQGAMRQPPRFPKRAMKGAAGELCVAFSKSRLRDIYDLCGGNISGEVTADGLRLSQSDTEKMTAALDKLKEKTARERAAEEARVAAEAEREAREAAKAAQREEKAARRSAKAQAVAERLRLNKEEQDEELIEPASELPTYPDEDEHNEL